MIYGVRVFIVAACRTCLRSQLSVTFGVLFRSSYYWQTKKNLVSLFFVQGSLTHPFALILFEPTRRGQRVGRWRVDPVHTALLWTGCFVRSGLTICSAGAGPKGTLISSISSSRFGGGLSSKSNAFDSHSMPHSQALVDTYFHFGSFYRHKTCSVPHSRGK